MSDIDKDYVVKQSKWLKRDKQEGKRILKEIHG